LAAKNGSNLLSLGWSYGPDASNNGNVMGATIGSTGRGAIYGANFE
jgi:hypothetical protein